MNMVRSCGVLILGALATGCLSPIDRWYAGEKRNQRRSERLERERAHIPYFGTGTVTSASGTVSGVVDYATVRFAPDPPPPFLAQFLVVRSNAVVGKLLLRSDPHDPVMMEVLEGIPQSGDRIIGIQNESKYKNRRNAGSP
jgi:hypothetical protein